MNIAIAPRFFKTELQSYSHWVRAWVREVFQNSADAGATKIDFSIDDNCVVWVTDNGRGMSQQILENKFLTLGETGKGDDVSSVGGFGKAKVVICFSHLNYSIRSHDWICEGSGGSYEIRKSDNFLRGVSLCVALDYKNKQNVINAIKYVFELSEFRGVVTINGEQIKSGYHKGRLVKELSFANVFHNKTSGAKNKIVFRVGGIYMFDTYTNLDSCVTVEIDPAKSREILLANRDSLQYTYQDEVNQFINLLAVEKEKLFKKKTRNFIASFGGGFMNFNKPRKTIKIGFEEGYGWPTMVERDSMVIANQTQARYTFSDNAQRETERESLSIADSLLSTMIVVNESDDQKIFNVSKTYFPSYWEKYNSGGDKLKLLKMWNEAVRISLEKLCEKTGIENIDYAVGFVFDAGKDKTLAQCRKVDGGAYFLINPVDDDGKMSLSLNNKGDIFKLLSRASHEVTHFIESAHDVDFSYLRDDIFEMILEDSNEAINKLKEAKNS